MLFSLLSSFLPHVFLVPLFVLILTGVIVQLHTLSMYNYRTCLGAPYIYATVHSDLPNILKISRDGCVLSHDVLIGGPLTLQAELRSLAMNSYGNREALYVSNSQDGRSSILVT